jgi:hypothetical protein
VERNDAARRPYTSVNDSRKFERQILWEQISELGSARYVVDSDQLLATKDNSYQRYRYIRFGCHISV